MSRLAVSLASATVALGLALAMGAVLATPASHNPLAIRVDYGDLDLSAAADADTLYGRIEAASREACDHRGDKCVTRAIAAAVLQVDRPALTALYRARAARPA